MRFESSRRENKRMRGLAQTAGFLLCCAAATGAIAIEPALHVSIAYGRAGELIL
jgi:hypothetical protein